MTMSPRPLSAYPRDFCGATLELSGFPDLPAAIVYPAGVELLQQNAAVHAVHLIHEGLIKLEHLTSEGRSSIIALRAHGSLVGVAEAVHCTMSPVSAITAVRTTVSSVPTSTFQSLLTTNPGFCACIAKALSRDSHQATLLAIERANYDARGRLGRFLAEIAAQAPERTTPTRFHLPLSQADVARLLGCTPQHLSHLLTDFERLGVVVRKGGAIMWRPGGAAQQEEAGQIQAGGWSRSSAK
jgi:CRP-like cAMP-binding protein